MATPLKIRASVERIVSHGERTYSVFFAPEGRVPRFKPGQFLHLALDAYDPAQHWPESRVLSLASAPGEVPLRITYSVVGTFSGRMERELAPGRVVWLKLPYGEFVVRPAEEIVLIAGGTGMTPFVPYLSAWAHTPADTSRVRLLYGVRSPALFIFGDVVETCRQHRADFKALLKAEQPADGDTRVGRGRLHVDDVASLVDHTARAQYYLSGPPAMLTYFQAELKSRLGLPADQVKIDAWA